MKKFLIWSLAVLITLTAVVYQRLTGPTNPLRISFDLDGVTYKTKLPRSLETAVSIDDPDERGLYSHMEFKIEPAAENFPEAKTEEVRMYIMFKQYPGEKQLKIVDASYSEGVYLLKIPSSPPAGKIIYYPFFYTQQQKVNPVEEGVILRFKSPVSAAILIPHILFMFMAMLFSNYVGLMSYADYRSAQRFAIYVIITLAAGGLVFGPLVQQAAFGDYWTGWPFGADLTDTKTMFAFVVWIAAWWLNRKERRRYLYVIAAVIMLAVYTIPHSAMGSEFDYEKGEVVTGN